MQWTASFTCLMTRAGASSRNNLRQRHQHGTHDKKLDGYTRCYSGSSSPHPHLEKDESMKDWTPSIKRRRTSNAAVEVEVVLNERPITKYVERNDVQLQETEETGTRLEQTPHPGNFDKNVDNPQPAPNAQELGEVPRVANNADHQFNMLR
uniref:Uncharacterized protein n=1 Tax=Parascaris equorum TaxID=6256 RepID=A0A914RFZ1_PAREQ